MTMRAPGTLLQMMEQRAEQSGEAEAFRLLDAKCRLAQSVSFHALDLRARSIAAALQEVAQPGARALLVHPLGIDYVSSFLGCIYSGIVPVPAYCPGRSKDWNRLKGIVQDAQPAVMLTELSVQKTAAGMKELRDLTVVTSDNIAPNLAASWRRPDSKPSDLALLQYTSGSTSSPRGVMVSHENLVHNLRITQLQYGTAPGTTGVTWLPPYHDMGLIGCVLQLIYSGARGIMLTPFTFLRDPLNWLRAISDYGARISGAPSFAYRMCVERASESSLEALDLSAWEVAFCGAEPIRSSVMRRFAETFAPAGFRARSVCPCYGLAEATLVVTATTPGVGMQVHRKGAREVVDVGLAVGCEIAIVEPETAALCAEGEVGEVWVRGPSVALGYWNRPDETKAIFRATSADGSGPFLRTGDLGWMNEGALFISGRLKDVLVIDGKNHYPTDLEETIDAILAADRVGAAAVFAVEEDEETKTIAVCEQAEGRGETIDFEGLAARIRVEVLNQHGVALHAIAFVKLGQLPKTTSGKLQRSAARRMYEVGDFKVLGRSVLRGTRASSATAPECKPAEPPPDVLNFLRARVAELSGCAIDEIDTSRPFAEYGLASKEFIGLTVGLQDMTGRVLPETLLFDLATIDRVSEFLSQGQRERPHPRARPAEPIAVVGIGCRLPGGVECPEDFWQFLRDGGDAVAVIPKERWDVEDYFDPEPFVPGKSYARHIAAVSDCDKFDSNFFGISPKEARALDPQQRLALEVTWHALEDGGIPPSTLRGTRTGVFIGASGSDYERLFSDPDLVNVHSAPASALSSIAGRISYAYGFRGPSLVVDTACSSSLVAAHLACQSLGREECDVALAGGANLVLSPIPMLALAKLGALSRTGRCKAFDSSADGYVRGEGVAVVVLKRMCDAVADGDRIRAVIRGTCVNHGGQTNGLTAPNPQAQREVIMGALAAASISAERVGYVEAHGTGTPLGDQIELSVLEEVFGKRGDAPRLRVGSVKTNIGHLEAAAGVAGLIKAALCIDHREVARQLYSAHARVGSAAEELNVATVQEPWPDVERQPYAGVSSFGFSGTNAHLIVGPAPGMRVATTTRTGVPILTLSAKNPAQLRVLMRLWCDRIRLVKDHHELADLCAASARQRDHMLERFACVVRDRASLQQALDAPPGAHTTLHDERPPVPSLALLIGDGDEWVAAAKACAGSPGFQRELTAVVEALQPIAGPSVRLDCEAILAAGTHRAASKPAAFALRVAVIRTVQRWDLKTVRVLAAGECEAAAAYVAGLSTAEECLALPAERPVSQPVRFDCSADEEVTDVLSIGGVAIAGQHQRIWQMPVSAEAANVLLMELLKSAYLRSSNVDWTSVMAPPQQSVALPLYPFARVSHWLTSGRTQRPSEQGRMQLPNGG